MGAAPSEPMSFTPSPTSSLLTCKICCNNYDNNEHLPLLLPCSRTLCRSCIRRVVTRDKSMKCPVCFDTHVSVCVEQLKVNQDMLDVKIEPTVDETRASRSVTQSDNIQIILKVLEGTEYRLKVPASATISAVKEGIKKEYGFEPTTTRLCFRGRALRDHQTLTALKVKQGNTLQMLTNYHGGY